LIKNTENIKWLSSIILTFGLCLTAYNIFPLNLYIQLFGILGWLIVAYILNDKPLIFVNFIGVIILISGILNSI
tara:strand:+ start:805 stop:1026 length:222 start_codon:yes stop_codon:yes gene_type:complete